MGCYVNNCIQMRNEYEGSINYMIKSTMLQTLGYALKYTTAHQIVGSLAVRKATNYGT